MIKKTGSPEPITHKLEKKVKDELKIEYANQEKREIRNKKARERRALKKKLISSK